MDKRGWKDDAAHPDAVNGSTGFGYNDADTGGDTRPSPQAAGKAVCQNADAAPAQGRLLAFGPDHDRRWPGWEHAIPRQDTKPLAKRLIDKLGNLAAPMAEMPEELKRVESLGDGTAAAIKFVEAVILWTLKTRALDMSPAAVAGPQLSVRRSATQRGQYPDYQRHHRGRAASGPDRA